MAVSPKTKIGVFRTKMTQGDLRSIFDGGGSLVSKLFLEARRWKGSAGLRGHGPKIPRFRAPGSEKIGGLGGTGVLTSRARRHYQFAHRTNRPIAQFS